MNEAEMLRGQKVYINTEDLPELEEGEFYVADLLGCNVADESGNAVGVLKDVSAPAATMFMSLQARTAKSF